MSIEQLIQAAEYLDRRERGERGASRFENTSFSIDDSDWQYIDVYAS